VGESIALTKDARRKEARISLEVEERDMLECGVVAIVRKETRQNDEFPLEELSDDFNPCVLKAEYELRMLHARAAAWLRTFDSEDDVLDDDGNPCSFDTEGLIQIGRDRWLLPATHSGVF
jgi:hypothetical protein